MAESHLLAEIRLLFESPAQKWLGQKVATIGLGHKLSESQSTTRPKVGQSRQTLAAQARQTLADFGPIWPKPAPALRQAHDEDDRLRAFASGGGARPHAGAGPRPRLRAPHAAPSWTNDTVAPTHLRSPSPRTRSDRGRGGAPSALQKRPTIRDEAARDRPQPAKKRPQTDLTSTPGSAPDRRQVRPRIKNPDRPTPT